MTKKSIFSVILIIMLFVASLSLTGCGSKTDSDSGSDGSEAVYEEEGSAEEAPQGAVKARVELEEYAIHVEAGEDATVYGTINKSFGQDIIVLRGSEEVARMTLEGQDGESESFSIVVPGEAVIEEHTSFQIKGGEISGVVEETNTKTFTLNLITE